LFAWGETYSLFPTPATDTFGSRFATTNAGLLYTAKGTASLLVPYANKIHAVTGKWDMVFILAAGANFLAAVLAIGALKPWRSRVVARSTHQPETPMTSARRDTGVEGLGGAEPETSLMGPSQDARGSLSKVCDNAWVFAFVAGMTPGVVCIHQRLSEQTHSMPAHGSLQFGRVRNLWASLLVRRQSPYVISLLRAT